MTASKAYLREKEVRNRTSEDSIFIKLEMSKPNGERIILFGNFNNNGLTHIEGKSLGKFMLSNDGNSQ